MATIGYRGSKVPVAIISNAPAPYRIHVHERIVDEMPDVELSSIFLADENIQSWKFGSLDHIGAVQLGRGASLNDAGGVRGRFAEFRRGVRLIGELRRRRVGAVVVGGYGSVECYMAMVWGRLAGVPVLMASDSNIAADNNAGIKRVVKTALLRTIVRLVRGLLPCGQLGRAYFKQYGARDEQMFDYPYTADPAPIADIAFDAVERVMAKYGLDPDRKRFICSGRLVDFKGFDLAIDAFNQVADERHDWDLVIAGDGELRAALEARVRPDLRDRVKWLGFVADQSELATIYKASHIFVHPARREPWGVVVNEAVIAGLAVIASDSTGAAADLVEDGVNGYVVPTDDLNALVETMLDSSLPVRLFQFRRSSAVKLEDWYQKSDAIKGLRKALRSVGALPSGRPATVPVPAIARTA